MKWAADIAELDPQWRAEAYFLPWYFFTTMSMTIGINTLAASAIIFTMCFYCFAACVLCESQTGADVPAGIL